MKNGFGDGDRLNGVSPSSGTAISKNQGTPIFDSVAHSPCLCHESFRGTSGQELSNRLSGYNNSLQLVALAISD